MLRAGPRKATDDRQTDDRQTDDAVCSWQGIDLTAPVDEQRSAVRGHWVMSPWTRMLLRERITRSGPVPFVATLSGFVALTAEITGVDVACSQRTLLDLTALHQPSDWATAFHRARFPTGSGSQWLLWTPSRSPGAALRGTGQLGMRAQ